jgi:hypothetical protein
LNRILGDQPRGKVQRACRAKYGIGYTDNKKYQCDEFPFASTSQNANKVDLAYSVLKVPWQDNNAAGNILKQWYFNERIIAGEDYFVRITGYVPCGADDGAGAVPDPQC